MTATSFWDGTWNGQRQTHRINGFDVWISDLKLVGRGFGVDLDGLHFKGTERIVTYTPMPVPYEFLLLLPDLFDEPEAVLFGTIKE